MAGFNSRDHIIDSVVNQAKQEVTHFNKTVTAGTAGTWQTLWNSTGLPTAGSFTTSLGVQTSATPGALTIPKKTDSLGNTLTARLMSFGGVATQNCTLMVYDRLYVSNEATANTLVAGSNKQYQMALLTRYNTLTTCLLNEMWIELSTALANAAASLTLLSLPHTTLAGTVGPPGTVPVCAAGTMVSLPFGSGLNTSPSPRGILPVLNPTVVANAAMTVTGGNASGSHRMVILRPIARIPLIANVWNEVSFLDDVLGLPTIEPDPCLALTILNSTSAATNVWGSMTWAFS